MSDNYIIDEKLNQCFLDYDTSNNPTNTKSTDSEYNYLSSRKKINMKP